MALGQVGARTEGDVYQGLFFWRQAADLLRPESMVDRVVLEYDEATGVDDVAVFYRDPGVDAGGWMVTSDYFQLKYHVDNRNCYSADALIDPAFIRAKSSLLQKFYAAYANLINEHVMFRLHLASNWRWQQDDKLAQQLREYDGKLPRKFFEDGPRSVLGKIRKQWQDHLELDSDAFIAFARTLRFQLDHFGRRDFKNYVYSTLRAVGLRTPSADHAACPYDSLIQSFLMNGPNSFNQETFRALCERENLFVEPKSSKVRPFVSGIRSFVRFAERLEAEVDELICVSENFEGRHPLRDTSWAASASQVIFFLSDVDRRARLRAADSVIALECHGSLALLAGWELSRNSGVSVAPLQKPNLDVWRPDGGAATGETWMADTIKRDDHVDDIAICLSVTHNISEDVDEYLSTADAPSVSSVVLLSPKEGPSPQSIHGASHAHQLAVQLPELLAKARGNRRARIHVFFACPNALMFFIGQQREALGRLDLYEFDFGFERDGSYKRSLSLPFSAHCVQVDPEVSNDSPI
jgi:hypothetical protein